MHPNQFHHLSQGHLQLQQLRLQYQLVQLHLVLVPMVEYKFLNLEHQYLQP
jgi:hypothetical protein